MASLVAAGCLLFAGGSQDPKAAGTVAAVRQALGGDAALAGVTSFSIDGSATWFSDMGSMRYSIKVECQLPDKILVSRVLSQVTERDGINGNQLIRKTTARPPTPEPGGIDETSELKAAERERSLLRAKRWFAALTLLLFASPNAAYPLQLTDAGSDNLQEAPALVVDGRADDGAVTRLFVERVSHLPMAVRWMATREVPPGHVKLMPAPEIASAVNTFPVEHELHALDYKAEGGIRWPRLLVEYIAGRTVEELTVRKVTLNPKFPPDRFQPTK
jgi:hypothetical protein